MHETSLNLETVTPMFLRGFDNEQLELRPPPFKALFRYWWRTVQDYTVRTDLRDAEGGLFGNTNGRAPFSIRIPMGQLRGGELKKGNYRLLPHKSMEPTLAYEKEQPFCLKLITRDAASAILYEEIAKLSFLLGGVGNRSRRGFGSICDVNWNFANVNDLRLEVCNTLNGVSGVARFRINPHFPIGGGAVQIIESTIPHANFPCYPVIWRIYFGNPANDVGALLRNIGLATHHYSDPALGDFAPRMASPIHVRVQKVNNQFVPIVTQLNSVFPITSLHDPRTYQQKQLDFINAII